MFITAITALKVAGRKAEMTLPELVVRTLLFYSARQPVIEPSRWFRKFDATFWQDLVMEKARSQL